MPKDARIQLPFKKEIIYARFISPRGEHVQREIEIRTNPITQRSCRISYSRIHEKEPGGDSFPEPPPDFEKKSDCPFCRPQVFQKTPCLHPDLAEDQRLIVGRSVLFPNLFPYGGYSAVSLFDDNHFVEIGSAAADAYKNCLMNCLQYLHIISIHDPETIYMAITQNHLPSAGGSLIHPHFQINADRIAPNIHRFLRDRSQDYHDRTGRLILSDYLECEKSAGQRYIGQTGRWEWLAAFAPEGFFEIWGILPNATSLLNVSESEWSDLVDGIINTQRFYRKLNRNGYNLGLLAVESPKSCLELRVVLMVRSNYAPWVRNDHTGYEVMLGDMTTFTAPEQTAAQAKPFFSDEHLSNG